MRDVKFRAWGIKSKVMVDVAELLWTVGGLRAHGAGCYIEGGYRDGDEVEDNNIILMQYTGLKDKNGKEIYEGDIVYYETAAEDDAAQGYGPQALVEWLDKKASFVAMDSGDNLLGIHQHLEVIGNTYENPELLNTPSD